MVADIVAPMVASPELLRAAELASSGQGDEARAIVQKLANGGDAEALYTLADMYWRGALVELDWTKAVATFAAAEAAGNAIAGHVLTNLMASGVGCRRDWTGALERLSGEAAQDEQRAAILRLVEAMGIDDAGDPAGPPPGQQVLTSPDVWAFPALFTPAECLHLCALARPNLAPSLVTGPNLEQVPDPIRTSECATVHHLIEDPAVHALNRRLATASGSDFACGEPLLVLRYRPGQHYLNHLDALPGLTNQRVKTALVYLNDGYDGGQTAFPAARQAYRGQVGDAIVFRNVDDDGRADQASVHAGLPVVTGEKYLASRWIRENPMFDETGPLSD